LTRNDANVVRNWIRRQRKKGWLHDPRRTLHDIGKSRGGGEDHDQSAGKTKHFEPRRHPREMLEVLEELRADDDIAVVLTAGAGDLKRKPRFR
jgi:hypothetical protein